MTGTTGTGTGTSLTSSISFPLSPTQQASLANSSALLLPTWRSKVAAVKNTAPGTSYARILFLGDSQTLNAYSNGSASGDWVYYGAQELLAGMFRKSGVNCTNDSFMGYFYRGTNDGRVNAGAAWSIIGANAKSLGGPMALSASSANSLDFTPIQQADRFRIWYITYGGSATFNYNFNGGSDTLLSEIGSNALVSTTANATLGPNTIKFTRAAGTAFLTGLETWDSTKNSVRITTAGWSAATAGDMADTTLAYSPGNSIQIFAPDLTVIQVGANDIINAVSVATFTTNTQFLITKAKLSGDVILVTPPPMEVATTVSLAVQRTYIDALKALAITNNIPIISTFDRLVSYEVSNPLGYYMTGGFAQNVHFKGIGYGDQAQALFNMIGNV